MTKISTDRIVSLSAMVVGIGSLFMIVYQTHLMRQSQKASALPYLTIAIYNNEQGVALVLGNNGVGPALVESVRVRYKGRELEGDPFEFYMGLRDEADRLPVSVDRVLPGRLIPAGASVRMLGSEGPEGDKSPRMLGELLQLFEIAEVPKSWYVNLGASGTEKAVIEITYASVYGDRWRIRSDKIIPERL